MKRSHPEKSWRELVSTALSGLGTIVQWKDVPEGTEPASIGMQIAFTDRVSSETVSYVVTTRRLAEVRRFDLEAIIAHAQLLLESASRKSENGSLASANPLLVIEVPHLARATVDHIATFIRTHIIDPRLAIIITSPHGGRVVWFSHLPSSAATGLISATMPDPRHPAGASNYETPWSAFTFSDVNQLLLKVLAFGPAYGAAPTYWNGTRAVIRSPEDLAVTANVSIVSAYRFKKALEQTGWLTITASGQWHLTSQVHIATHWLAAIASLGPSPRISVKPLWRIDKSILQGLDRFIAKTQSCAWALTGWAACDHYHLSHVSGQKMVSLVADVSAETLMRAFRLVRCEPKEAVLTIERPRFPRSAFSGMGRTETGLPVVDAWQAALDVSWNPARGNEQAEFILQRLFGERDA